MSLPARYRRVGCFWLIILSVAAFGEVLSGRELMERVGNFEESRSITSFNSTGTTSKGDLVAQINREVPSSADPLHNK